MNKLSNISASILFGGLVAASSPFDAAAETIVWRYGHTLSVPGTLYEEILINEMPKRLEEASGGVLKVQPIVGMVTTDDVIPALAQGRIEMGDVTTGYIAATYPKWAVLNLPGLGDDMERIEDLSKDVVLPIITADLAPKGITPVAALGWLGGAFFTRTPINTAEELGELKWRTHSPMLSELIEAVGGATVGMPYAELYPSLERGLVDAYTSTIPAVAASGLHEVTDYAVLGPNGTSITVLMVSDAAMQKLPEDVREKVAAELEALAMEIPGRLYEENEQAIAKLEERGVEVIELPDAEQEELINISQESIWKNWLSQVGEQGQPLVNEVQKRIDP